MLYKNYKRKILQYQVVLDTQKKNYVVWKLFSSDWSFDGRIVKEYLSYI
jgi:hypothetical protein